jgi:large subunit ribosomal protein L4
MASAKLYSMTGDEQGSQELADEIFATEVKPYSMHQAVKAYLNNQRQGTHSTLGRSEVRGGGSKPWRQKGTGRARVGTNRSPLWEGGGIIFGPKPRDYTTRLPKKLRRRAIKSALTLKAQEERILVVEPREFEKPRTRSVVEMLEKMEIAGTRVLFLNTGINQNLQLSCRNIPKFVYKRAAQLNVYDVLGADYVLLTPDGLKECEEVFAK